MASEKGKTNAEGFEPTREDLMDAAAALYGELELVKAAARDTHEHAVAYREMLMMVHKALREKEETGAVLTPTEFEIRRIIGSPEVTRAEAERDN